MTKESPENFGIEKTFPSLPFFLNNYERNICRHLMKDTQDVDLVWGNNVFDINKKLGRKTTRENLFDCRQISRLGEGRGGSVLMYIRSQAEQEMKKFCVLFHLALGALWNGGHPSKVLLLGETSTQANNNPINYSSPIWVSEILSLNRHQSSFFSLGPKSFGWTKAI
jgi:hypothetical protein